jgi:hypothetical protein
VAIPDKFPQQSHVEKQPTCYPRERFTDSPQRNHLPLYDEHPAEGSQIERGDRSGGPGSDDQRIEIHVT